MVVICEGRVHVIMVIVIGKWTHLPEFKSWTRLLAFHIVLIPLGKGMTPTILSLGVNRVD